MADRLRGRPRRPRSARTSPDRPVHTAIGPGPDRDDRGPAVLRLRGDAARARPRRRGAAMGPARRGRRRRGNNRCRGPSERAWLTWERLRSNTIAYFSIWTARYFAAMR